MSSANLCEPATVSLSGAGSVDEMARREAWTPDFYTLALSENIRSTAIPIDAQRERLAALAQLGGALSQTGDQAAADALAQHYAILEALHHRFSREAFEALRGTGPRAAEIAERFLNASLKAQRAAMSVLSALKVLRDSQAPGGAPTTSTPAPATPQAS